MACPGYVCARSAGLRNGESVLLVGCPGVGKTSLLRELSRASALYFMQSHNKGNVTNSLVVVVDKDDEICGGGHGVGVHASVKPAIR